ncbi:hypothetical protein ACPA9J_05895 [Pseudomonas aeruginosa]
MTLDRPGFDRHFIDLTTTSRWAWRPRCATSPTRPRRPCAAARCC